VLFNKNQKMRISLILIALCIVVSCKKPNTGSVEETMDNVVTRLYEKHTPEQLDTLDHSYMLGFLSEQERESLATNYWKFKVDVPVKVSLMRHKKQEVIPFWLASSGFKKTDLEVASEMYEYEVWEKDFPAGLVSLGINGFDKHRPVYFVSVAPQKKEDELTISPVFPAKQHFEKMGIGAFTYHDWDGLKLSQVPQELEGQVLLTTVRGRAREAHTVKAFRKTNTPSSTSPDQILLTYNDDTKNSVAISWRTSLGTEVGEVLYWKIGSTDTLIQKADVNKLQDRMLQNDRYVNRYTASLKNLSEGAEYQYQVRGNEEILSFKTPSSTDSFSFVWFGDTHNDPKWGEMLSLAHSKHPETEFYTIAGDLVNTGLHRDDWDKFFEYAGKAFAEKPLMAIPGNHDSQDGLGAGLFQDLLKFPHNGPVGLSPGLTHTFTYKNALYLMIDAASFSNDDQTAWIEEQLKNSNATWKFLYVHFPPFNEVEPYPEMVEKWVPLFDKYQLDFVISGHFHYYLRSYPMKAGKIEPKGTIYMTSVGTSAAREAKDQQPFVSKRVENGNFYQVVNIKGNKLEMIAHDSQGKVVDRFEVVK
jgi:predicted phosphodiesterase